MLLQRINKLVRQHGSQAQLAKRLGIDASSMSKLISGHDVSQRVALLFDDFSNGEIPAEEILAHCGKIDLSRQLERIKHASQKKVVGVNAQAYLTETPLFTVKKDKWPFCQIGYPVQTSVAIKRPLLVDEEKQLLSGFLRLQSLKSQDIEKVTVLMIDLVLLLKEGELIIAPCALSILERIAIGLALESEFDRRKRGQGIYENGQGMPFSCPNWGKTVARKEILIAKICGLRSKNTYQRAKCVFKQGIPELLKAVNEKNIKIYRASEIAPLPADQQQAALTDFLNLNPQQKQKDLNSSHKCITQ